MARFVVLVAGSSPERVRVWFKDLKDNIEPSLLIRWTNYSAHLVGDVWVYGISSPHCAKGFPRNSVYICRARCHG